MFHICCLKLKKALFFLKLSLFYNMVSYYCIYQLPPWKFLACIFLGTFVLSLFVHTPIELREISVQEPHIVGPTHGLSTRWQDHKSPWKLLAYFPRSGLLLCNSSIALRVWVSQEPPNWVQHQAQLPLASP